MTYSLSQLDAIGDVDPVAEADVYLAYGRDLQAEEILKEAMRSNPERLAIRTKLLEVYAKRRDIKGFELLATQLFALTRGEGEDWAKAQELGSQIDPENPLYRAGGAPERPTRRRRASPSRSARARCRSRSSRCRRRLQPRSMRRVDASATARSTASTSTSTTPTSASPSQPAALDVTESIPPRPGRRAGVVQQSTTLKMPLVANEAAPRRVPTVATSRCLRPLRHLARPRPAGRRGRGSAARRRPASRTTAVDPLSRKLELAEEFQRIGDKDGARDLLREVLATASGAAKTKAQGMLDRIS